MSRICRFVVENASMIWNMRGASRLRSLVRSERLYFRKKSSSTIFFLFCSSADRVTCRDSRPTVLSTNEATKSRTMLCADLLYFEVVQYSKILHTVVLCAKKPFHCQSNTNFRCGRATL